MIMRSESDHKMDLNSDGSATDFCQDDDSGNISLDDRDGSRTDLHSEPDSSTVDSFSDSDSGIANMFSETDTSKTDSHCDSDQINHDHDACSKTEENTTATQTLQQQPTVDSASASSSLFDTHLLALVQSLYDPGFIAELQHQVDVAASNQVSCQGGSSSDGDGAQELAAPHQVFPNGQYMFGLEDLIASKEEIGDDLMMPLDGEQQGLDMLAATLNFDASEFGISTTTEAPSISLNDVSADSVTPAHPSMDHSSAEMTAGRDLVGGQMAPSDSMEVEVKGIQVGDAHQAIIPDLRGSADSDPELSTGTLMWDPSRMKEADLLDYLEEAGAINPNHTSRTREGPGCRTADDEVALTSLHQHGYVKDRALCRLRERGQWNESPLSQWSEEECLRFVAGLKRYGKKFSSIQQTVKTRSVKAVVLFYYWWKRSERHGSYEEKKKLANLGNLSFTGWMEDDLEDEDLREVSPWKRARRERSTSPVRSLINSRHKTPPPALELQDKSATAVTPAVAPTDSVPCSANVTGTLAGSRDQHGGFSAFNNMYSPKQSSDLESSSDSSDVSHLGHLARADPQCDLSSSESSTVSNLNDVQDSEHKYHLNTSGSSDVADMNGAPVSQCRCHIGSSSSSDKPGQCPKCLCNDLSSDSSDAPTVNSRRSKKRGRSRGDLNKLEFGGIFRDIKRIKRCVLGTSPQGSGRSDMYNSDTEGYDSDTSEEATSLKNAVSGLHHSPNLSSPFSSGSHYMSYLS